jgi:hypothetical protein
MEEGGGVDEGVGCEGGTSAERLSLCEDSIAALMGC